jgi:hypothetical protein
MVDQTSSFFYGYFMMQPRLMICLSMYTGWWCNNHLENMKVNGKDYPIHFGKIKNAPNHQPDYLHYMI